jgi:uncharacterized Ntn-hydrolase superfamily protein
LTDILKSILFSGTFSILGISTDSRLMAVAVASGSTSVGDRVPHAEPGVGAIATQAYTNITYGTKGLGLLTEGMTPYEALHRLLQNDPEKEFRQVAIMDFKRRKTVFTGANAPIYSAEAQGEEYVIIGNLLSRKDVVNKMAKQFERSREDLATKMVEALKAGRQAGGDRRGERSAALIVVNTERVEVEIKVDASRKPIEDLSRQLRLR